jgi:hypothetical protein
MANFSKLYRHYNRPAVDDTVRTLINQGGIRAARAEELIPLMQYLEDLCYLPVLYSVISVGRMALTIEQAPKQHMIKIVIPLFKARCIEHKINCWVETGPETFDKDCWSEHPITDYVLSINF